jgi:GH15 family glucan-1,4-alpha-glucosidase
MWHSDARASVGSDLRCGRGLVYGSPMNGGHASSLDLALIGNGTIGALVDASAAVSWCCFPRFDGDPVFCALLAGENPANACGSFTIELVGAERSEQEYLSDTPILVTRFYDDSGNGLEVIDFCPRYADGESLKCPPLLVRQLRPISGNPAVRVAVSPASGYGCALRRAAAEGNRINYAGEPRLRLTMNASTEPIIDVIPFYLQEPITLTFGVDDLNTAELLTEAPKMLERTTNYWQNWARSLHTPGQWRDAVVRAAITLELNVYEPTGAIIPAVTTSIPEAPDTGRNWDYRYCWPRDGYFTADALRRLGDTRPVERFLSFLLRVAESTDDARLVPIYDIDGGSIPAEHFAECLSGYRGMGPVRIGNKASEQAQHDLYGEAVLSAEGMFRTSRAGSAVDEELFASLEPFGQHAERLYDQPDAGLWELRGAARVHTYSSVMCWVACDRLAKYAERLSLDDRAEYWRSRATDIHAEIWRRSWNAKLNAFTATMEGDSLDASLLLLPRLGFLEADDPRFVGTVAAIESQLKHGDFVYRYVERDDFGYPENAFLVCTFWYIEALASMGGARREEARVLFEKVLAARNRHGLLAEDLDTRTLEQWGNFPQTYCMAGNIDCPLALEKNERPPTTTG